MYFCTNYILVMEYNIMYIYYIQSDELLHQLEDSEPVMIVTEFAFLDIIKDAAKLYGKIKVALRYLVGFTCRGSHKCYVCFK